MKSTHHGGCSYWFQGIRDAWWWEGWNGKLLFSSWLIWNLRGWSIKIIWSGWSSSWYIIWACIFNFISITARLSSLGGSRRLNCDAVTLTTLENSSPSSFYHCCVSSTTPKSRNAETHFWWDRIANFPWRFYWYFSLWSQGVLNTRA